MCMSLYLSLQSLLSCLFYLCGCLPVSSCPSPSSPSLSVGMWSPFLISLFPNSGLTLLLHTLVPAPGKGETWREKIVPSPGWAPSECAESPQTPPSSRPSSQLPRWCPIPPLRPELFSSPLPCVWHSGASPSCSLPYTLCGGAGPSPSILPPHSFS